MTQPTKHPRQFMFESLVAICVFQHPRINLDAGAEVLAHLKQIREDIAFSFRDQEAFEKSLKDTPNSEVLNKRMFVGSMITRIGIDLGITDDEILSVLDRFIERLADFLARDQATASPSVAA